MPNAYRPWRGATAAALVFFLFACETAPLDNDERLDRISRQNSLGTAWLGQQKWSDAEAALREGLELAPGDPVLLVNLALALGQQGKRDEARDAIERALDAAPENIHAQYVLGLLDKADGRFEEAARHFEAVREADPDDVATLYNLGSVLAALDDRERAEEAFRAALELNPVHVSATYGLGRLLVAAGELEEGRRLIALSQEIRARSGIDDSVGARYGEQGYYALGIDYPADRLPPPPRVAVSFEGAPDDGETQAPAIRRAPPWTLAPLGADGIATLVAAGERGVASIRDDAVELLVPALSGGTVRALAAGDLDADGSVELVALVVTSGSAGTAVELRRINRESGNGWSWSDDPETRAERVIFVEGEPDGVALTLVDRDHDGDLDPFACFTGTRTVAGGARCLVGTHRAPGRIDVARDIVRLDVPFAASGPVHVSFTDVDLDRDIDLLVGDALGVHVLSNLRDGRFENVSQKLGLGDAAGAVHALDLGDLDRDGRMDVVVASPESVRVCEHERRSRFVCREAMPIDAEPRALVGVAVLDADLDGLLDVAAGAIGGRTALLLNRGKEGLVVDEEAFDAASEGWVPLAALDADGDGDPDIAKIDRGVGVSLNAGPPKHAWIAIRPVGVRDNRLGIGTRIDVLAGASRQHFEVRRPLPVRAGLGTRESIDAVRLLWPGGVLQDEIEIRAREIAALEQLDRKGTSCPLLYAWRGGRWHFETDLLGGCAIGYRLAPGALNTPDTNEYVRIAGGLDDDGGTLRVRLNNQLEEVIWFDEVALYAIDHPADAEVYPDERLMPGPPWPEFRLFASSDVRPVAAAREVETGRDVTERLAEVDRKYVDGFALLPYKGYAERHALEIDLGTPDPGARVVLLLDGWIDYADSSANVAAAQAGVSLLPPRLLVPDAVGGWRVANPRIGFPAGLPKAMTVELTGLLVPGDARVRIETSMRIYWDRARVMVGGEDTPLDVARLSPSRAELRYGGFPRQTSPDGRPPFAYDPETVDPASPWKAHSGRYTGFGLVTPLVSELDDRLVTTKSGDEMELVFDSLPPPGPGRARTFLLFADGFGKDMDPNSAASETVGPIPFHGMPLYPYGDETVPPDVGGYNPPRVVPPDDRGLPGTGPPLGPPATGRPASEP